MDPNQIAPLHNSEFKRIAIIPYIDKTSVIINKLITNFLLTNFWFFISIFLSFLFILSKNIPINFPSYLYTGCTIYIIFQFINSRII